MTYDQRKADYLAKFATLPEEKQRIHLSIALRRLLSTLGKVAPTTIDGDYNVLDDDQPKQLGGDA